MSLNGIIVVWIAGIFFAAGLFKALDGEPHWDYATIWFVTVPLFLLVSAGSSFGKFLSRAKRSDKRSDN